MTTESVPPISFNMSARLEFEQSLTISCANGQHTTHESLDRAIAAIKALERAYPNVTLTDAMYAFQNWQPQGVQIHVSVRTTLESLVAAAWTFRSSSSVVQDAQAVPPVDVLVRSINLEINRALRAIPKHDTTGQRNVASMVRDLSETALNIVRTDRLMGAADPEKEPE